MSRKKKSKDKILRARDLQMCLWFAEMKTAQEVADLVTENYKITYTRQAAWQFSKRIKWRRIIKHLKDRFLKDLAAIPIANKAVRLNALQTIYLQALTKSLKIKNQFGKIYELKLGAAIEALKAARIEIEGEKSLIDASVHKTFVYLDQKAVAEEKIAVGSNRITSQLSTE
jgi:hypothetical protein